MSSSEGNRNTGPASGAAQIAKAFAAVALVAALLGGTTALAQQEGVSQRSRGSVLSGTQPFDSNWSRGGARANEAARPYQDPARLDRRFRDPCSSEALARDPARLRQCR